MPRDAPVREKTRANPPASGVPRGAMEAAAAAAIVIVTLLAYRPALSGGFIWDDYTYIINGELNRDPSGLTRIWFSTDPVDYFPVAYTLQWIEYRLWKLDPEPYHVINIGLHCAAAVLLGLTLKRLAVPGAWIAAGLFAVHPVNVESVAWIYQQRTTLPLVFALIATLAFLRYERAGRIGWQAASVAAFVLALLSKTSVVMFPLVLLGLCWWRRGAIRRLDVLRVVPHFVAALGLGMVTFWFQYQRAIGTAIIREDNLVARLATAAWAIWFYAYKAFVPLNLAFVYPRWVVNAASVRAWLPLAALIVLFGVLWRTRKGWGRGPLAALGYYVIMLLPMLGFINIFFMKYSLVADHWQYVAIPGLLALPGAGLALLVERKPPAGAICTAAVICLLAGLTFQQTKIYADETAIWNDTIRKNPSAWIAYNNLGTRLIRSGQYEQSRTFFEKTIELFPRFGGALTNLAIVEAMRGNTSLAMDLCRRAIALHDEGEADALANLGRLLFVQGRTQEAIEQYRKAIALDNRFILAHMFLGEALMSTGRTEEAEAQIREVLRLDPGNADARSLLESRSKR